MSLLGKVRNRIRDKSGASILIALVLMIVLLTVGVSVLTAANVSVQSTANVLQKKQLYYAARSVADSVTRGLTEDTRVAAVWSDYIGQNWDEIRKNNDEGGYPYFVCGLLSGDLPEELRAQGSSSLNMEPLHVYFTGDDVVDDAGGIKDGTVMMVDFVIYYGDNADEQMQYHLNASYRYNQDEAKAGKTGWNLEGYGQNAYDG
ncbi:hypothetical protein LJC56_00790 [Christensenellaceae bacterium OttesenSCG-928-K19]|nr:hypothetical protein [Christensenellaceae bacterium OttesenSCG-928-K19]